MRNRFGRKKKQEIAIVSVRDQSEQVEPIKNKFPRAIFCNSNEPVQTIKKVK